jgi:hypothetical protein
VFTCLIRVPRPSHRLLVEKRRRSVGAPLPCLVTSTAASLQMLKPCATARHATRTLHAIPTYHTLARQADNQTGISSHNQHIGSMKAFLQFTHTTRDTQAYPSRSLYFSPLLSSAASSRSITPSTFSSSSLRPMTCTATGNPAIFTAS